jgi:hypothetical protein
MRGRVTGSGRAAAREVNDMNTQRDPYHFAHDGRRATGMPAERRLPLSDIIHHRLLTIDERDRQRSRLLNAIIFAQALLTVATGVGYLALPSAVVHVALAGIAVAVYVVALAANQFFRRVSLAAYLLVVGGGIAVAAQSLSFALAPGGTPAEVAQAALLFIAIIIEAGVLFAPEATLLIAVTTTVLAAFAILFSLSLAPGTDKAQAYLFVVYTAGLQALAGLLAWLVSQFIFESVLEAERAQELQFAHARLEALNAQVAEQQQQTDATVSALQLSIARAIGGEPNSRADLAEIRDGALSPLAESLNLLLQRLEDAMRAERMIERLGAAALPMMDAIARMSDAPTPIPASQSFTTNSPLDSVQVMLSQMQGAVAQRMSRVQRLVGEIVGALSHSQEPLEHLSQAVQDGQSIAGALRSVAEQLIETTNRQLGLLNQARRTLSRLLPPDVTQSADFEIEASALAETDGGSLRGLGSDLGIDNPGLTGQFTALQPDDEIPEMSGFVPLTKPMPTVHPDETGQPEGSGSRKQPQDAAKGRSRRGEATNASAEGVPPELVEVWKLLSNANDEAAQLERVLGQLARELGVQSRALNTADANAAWFKGAIAAMRARAAQLQQVAGSGQPVPASPDGQPGPTSRPLGPSPLPRPPFATRPLQDDHAAPPLETLEELAAKMRSGERSDDDSGDDEEGPAPGSLRAADLLSFDGPSSSLAGLPLYADEQDEQNP